MTFSEFSEFQRLRPQSVDHVCHVKDIDVDNMCIAVYVDIRVLMQYNGGLLFLLLMAKKNCAFNRGFFF